MLSSADGKRAVLRSSREHEYKILGLVRRNFLRCSRLLGLPQVAVDGYGVYAGRHGLSWDLAKLFPVRVVLEQTVDHLARDALGSDSH